jgi:hypothetical protein
LTRVWTDTPTGRLERIHCVIASQILERNAKQPYSHDFDLTRSLDVELQRAARSLPGKWWIVPNLNVVTTDSQALFWNTRRLFAQIIHYNLLNQLHLPYMLRSSSAEHKYKYSLVACVNASREMILRFITLRNFNGVAHSCRTVDFLALMAAMTLLLAHLDSPLSETENLLAHQYHSDRAMIEQVQENMEEINRANSDALSAKSAELLRQLLAIDVEATNGSSLGAKGVSVLETRSEIAMPDHDDDAVSVHIPYFGIVKIALKSSSKVISRPEVTSKTYRPIHRPQLYSAGDVHGDSRIGAHSPTEPDRSSDMAATSQAMPSDIAVETSSTVSGVHRGFELQLQNDFCNPMLDDGAYPGLAAGAGRCLLR